jgi:D-glycero-beta-D-manno-heptose-7-phosphate kinase
VDAQAREVFDVTGAGDTVIAVLTVLVAAGMPLRDALVAANAAAGRVVARLGTAALTWAELQQACAEHPVLRA